MATNVEIRPVANGLKFLRSLPIFRDGVSSAEGLQERQDDEDIRQEPDSSADFDAVPPIPEIINAFNPAEASQPSWLARAKARRKKFINPDRAIFGVHLESTFSGDFRRNEVLSQQGATEMVVNVLDGFGRSRTEQSLGVFDGSDFQRDLQERFGAPDRKNVHQQVVGGRIYYSQRAMSRGADTQTAETYYTFHFDPDVAKRELDIYCQSPFGHYFGVSNRYGTAHGLENDPELQTKLVNWVSGEMDALIDGFQQYCEDNKEEFPQISQLMAENKDTGKAKVACRWRNPRGVLRTKDMTLSSFESEAMNALRDKVISPFQNLRGILFYYVPEEAVIRGDATRIEDRGVANFIRHTDGLDDIRDFEGLINFLIQKGYVNAERNNFWDGFVAWAQETNNVLDQFKQSLVEGTRQVVVQESRPKRVTELERILGLAPDEDGDVPNERLVGRIERASQLLFNKYFRDKGVTYDQFTDWTSLRILLDNLVDSDVFERLNDLVDEANDYYLEVRQTLEPGSPKLEALSWFNLRNMDKAEFVKHWLETDPVGFLNHIAFVIEKQYLPDDKAQGVQVALLRKIADPEQRAFVNGPMQELVVFVEAADTYADSLALPRDVGYESDATIVGDEIFDDLLDAAIELADRADGVNDGVTKPEKLAQVVYYTNDFMDASARLTV